MTTAAPSAALATIQPVFTDAERVALAGFLTGYRGLTREAETTRSGGVAIGHDGMVVLRTVPWALHVYLGGPARHASSRAAGSTASSATPPSSG